MQHARIHNGARPIIGLVICGLFIDREIERGFGNFDSSMHPRERGDLFVVRRIISGIANRSAEIDILCGADILIVHIRVEIRRIEMNGAGSNIIVCKTVGTYAAMCQCVHKRILHGFLPVIHALSVQSAGHTNLALADRNVRPAQIRAVLIRPDDRLRPRIADAVRFIGIRSGISIFVDFIRINGRLIFDVCLITGHIRRIRINDTQILAVIGQPACDIRAVIRFQGVCCIVNNSSILIIVLIIICRRRGPIHKRGQQRSGAPLIDAPRCPGITVVVDAPSGIGIRGMPLFIERCCSGKI